MTVDNNTLTYLNFFFFFRNAGKKIFGSLEDIQDQQWDFYQLKTHLS